jgi:protein-disulfide isomerase
LSERNKMLQAAAGVTFLALALVMVLIVVSASSGGDGGDTALEGRAEVDRLLRGIPQAGLVLGDPGAPVELVEFGDLQCPFCKGFAEEILPAVIEGPVAGGEATLAFHNYTIIGPDSLPAGAAAIAAGSQGRGWNYVELFYRNQGEENSGYADDAFLEAVAKGAGVENLAKWQEDRRSTKTAAEIEASTAAARRLGFDGTPSFAIKGPGTDGLEPLGTPSSAEGLEQAIERAAG